MTCSMQLTGGGQEEEQHDDEIRQVWSKKKLRNVQKLYEFQESRHEWSEESGLNFENLSIQQGYDILHEVVSENSDRLFRVEVKQKPNMPMEYLVVCTR